ncbi:MAG: hypothetical protein EAZ97_06715 [Bacteroidetes bacterium]|nr:MAG: hypothetical protein EAZ97_06715 [Bacteroidota bacterium]
MQKNKIQMIFFFIFKKAKIILSNYPIGKTAKDFSEILTISCIETDFFLIFFIHKRTQTSFYQK